MSDGRWELVQLVQLLHAANQKPLRFQALCDIEIKSGIPAIAFDGGQHGPTGSFAALANNLKSLSLEIVSLNKRPKTEKEVADLAQFLHQATELEVLTIGLPATTTPRAAGRHVTV